MLVRILSLLTLFWLMAGTAFAQQSVDLYVTRMQIDAVYGLAENGNITLAQAKTGADHILEQAGANLGRTVTLVELANAQPPMPASTSTEITWLQRAAGFVTFANTMMTLAAIIGMCAFLFLFGRAIAWMVFVIVAIPPEFYEGLLILSGIGLSAFAFLSLEGGNASAIGLVGALLYGGGALWVWARHDKNKKLSVSGISLILAAAWGAHALLFQSSLVGTFSIAALMSVLGFSAYMVPGLIMIGFEDEDTVPRATLASFLILGTFVGFQILGESPPFISVFRPGALYVCGFVGYLGVLITGSRWYYSNANYLLRQIPAVVLGIAAIFLGSIFNVPELQKMGGTFFVLYLMEKPFEIPAENKTAYALIALAVCTVIYFSGMWVKANVDIVSPYLFFV